MLRHRIRMLEVATYCLFAATLQPAERQELPPRGEEASHCPGVSRAVSERVLQRFAADCLRSDSSQSSWSVTDRLRKLEDNDVRAEDAFSILWKHHGPRCLALMLRLLHGRQKRMRHSLPNPATAHDGLIAHVAATACCEELRLLLLHPLPLPALALLLGSVQRHLVSAFSPHVAGSVLGKAAESACRTAAAAPTPSAAAVKNSAFTRGRLFLDTVSSSSVGVDASAHHQRHAEQQLALQTTAAAAVAAGRTLQRFSCACTSRCSSTCTCSSGTCTCSSGTCTCSSGTCTCSSGTCTCSSGTCSSRRYSVMQLPVHPVPQALEAPRAPFGFEFLLQQLPPSIAGYFTSLRQQHGKLQPEQQLLLLAAARDFVLHNMSALRAYGSQLRDALQIEEHSLDAATARNVLQRFQQCQKQQPSRQPEPVRVKPPAALLALDEVYGYIYSPQVLKKQVRACCS
ncbi:hypothetical protein cyc_07878 [Cyclospora cayetanensis]|uniref:Uncharacterized protein n=1 Tax=Cyclospora cayetanensis TaxID=88456 RepID=A0A1D3CRW0_9EIME|nr:hypothetical protein cyc_07878 [Cyclospora cayetanensis]